MGGQRHRAHGGRAQRHRVSQLFLGNKMWDYGLLRRHHEREGSALYYGRQQKVLPRDKSSHDSECDDKGQYREDKLTYLNNTLHIEAVGKGSSDYATVQVQQV